MNLSIRLAESDSDIAACSPIMHRLRPQIPNDQFLARVRSQALQGYRLATASLPAGIVAVAGFRTSLNLAWGRFLYVDDLVTAKRHRSHGYGGALLEWLSKYAQDAGCTQLHLDSGLQRTDAHRLYRQAGMDATGYHFARSLG